MTKITDTVARAAEPREKPYEIYDDELKGFCLTVQPSGVKTFRYRYRNALNQKRNYTIERFGTVGAKSAREIAAKKARLVAEGQDPVADEAAAKEAAALAEEAAKNRFTVRQFGQMFMTIYAVEKKHSQNTLDLNKHILEGRLYPAWGDRPAEEITEDDAAALLREIAEDGHYAMSDAVRTLISTMWRWGKRRRPRLVPVNIVEDIEPYNPKAKKTWFIPEDRIGEFWHAAGALPREFGLPAQIMLATFSRPHMVIGALKTEFNVALTEWHIPGDRMKGEFDHVIPITGFLRPLIREAMKMSGNSYYLFPRATDPSTPRNSDNFGSEWRVKREALGFPELTPRGLRTTCTTHAPRAKISAEIKEKLLSHVDGSVTGKHYDFFGYADEKREALERWHAWLLLKIGMEDARSAAAT